MAATALVGELGKVAEKVQDQAMNENSPYRGEPILDETSRGKSLDELRANIIEVRREMIASVRSLPNGAFDEQPPDADGNPVWSAGEIITHTNGSLISIAGRASERIGIDPPAWTDDQHANAGRRALDRDAATEAAEMFDLTDWLNAISAGADLENTVDHPAWGTLNGRALLHFIAVHEANHVEQLEELRTAHG